MNAAFGQNGFLTAALMCGGLLALERRPVLAGILIGALSFKPQFGVLIPFVLLAGGFYRSFAVAAATTGVLVLASILLGGTAPWIAFLAEAIPAQRDFLERFMGLYQTLVPSYVMAARLLGLPLSLGYAAQAIAGLVALVACCWAIRQPAPHPEKVAVLLVGAVIATPYCFGYDLDLLVAAQVMTWRRHARSGDVLQAAVWLLPVLMIFTGLAGVPIAPVVLLAMLYLGLRQVRAGRLAEAAPVPA
jgi:hypothetical protein